MKKVIVCKTTDKYADYETVSRFASGLEHAEVSDDDYWLLESYIHSSCDLVLLTVEPQDRIAEFIELAREQQKKVQEQQKRTEEKRKNAEEKRKKADLVRATKQKEQKLKKAIALLRKEGITVEGGI